MRHFFYWFIVFIQAFAVFAQDAQFSQFYSAPLYLNPAYAGTIENTRVTANYRNQWPTAGKQAYTSSLASIDHYFAKKNSGVGFMLMQNRAGASHLSSTEASLIYSFHIDLNYRWKFIPAIQATLVDRNIDYAALTFPDQYVANSGYTGASGEPLNYSNKIYGDFSTGGLLYSEIFWFGASYHHLNHPDQSFSGSGTHLPGELNLHAGAKIPIENKSQGRSTHYEYTEKSLMPSILYKQQGNFSQLDIGMCMMYEPLILGVYYRGLPIKHYSSQYPNRESVILMVGYNYKKFTFGYSYDIVISRLTTSSGGANEISLNYLFGKEQDPRKNKAKRRTPCPSFYHH
jgi:type IX secretion system PorP/SprF family membrane protein